MERSLSQVAADSALPDEGGNVMFVLDQTNRVRAFPADHLEDAHLLNREMSSFEANARNFGENVDSLIGVVTAEAKKIEEEQNKLLGVTVALEAEKGMRAAELRRIRGEANELQAELARLRVYRRSLEKVEAEQQALFERLTSPA